MDQVLRHVRSAIERDCLLARGEKVIVGVSGGPDSLCLLHLLCRLAGDLTLELHATHVHHGLRGSEADADAAFVQAIAVDWGLACHVEHTDVPALSRRFGWAMEEAARRARYYALARVAQSVGARTIAVGHNADDQAETVLMHILRGAGLAGLRGMLPRTSLGDYRLVSDAQDASAQAPLPADLYLIRPLLDIPRADIQAYCERHGLEPRFDRSNLDTTHFRNWLRHVAFPLLEQHNPGLKTVLRRSARVIVDDYALLRLQLEAVWDQVVQAEGEEAIVFDLTTWRELPPSLQRSCLREAVHRLRRSLRNINFVHIEDALHVAQAGTTGMQATLPEGLMLSLGYHHLRVADADHPTALPEGPWLPANAVPLPLPCPGVVTVNAAGWAVRLRPMDRCDLPPDWAETQEPWRATLDADALGEELYLRPRRPGDRFQPQGMGGHQVKLGDFFTNQKVPRAFRSRLPLLETEWGIAWVAGLRVDHRACVRAATARVVQVDFSGPAPSPRVDWR